VFATPAAAAEAEARKPSRNNIRTACCLREQQAGKHEQRVTNEVALLLGFHKFRRSSVKRTNDAKNTNEFTVGGIMKFVSCNRAILIYSSLFAVTVARKHNNSTEKNRTT